MSTCVHLRPIRPSVNKKTESYGPHGIRFFIILWQPGCLLRPMVFCPHLAMGLAFRIFYINSSNSLS